MIDYPDHIILAPRKLLRLVAFDVNMRLATAWAAAMPAFDNILNLTHLILRVWIDLFRLLGLRVRFDIGLPLLPLLQCVCHLFPLENARLEPEPGIPEGHDI